MSKRTLLMTLPPFAVGGVGAKARILADELADAGHDVTIAYYRLPDGAKLSPQVFGEFPQIEIKCQRTLFEQNYTAASPQWRAVINGHDRHIAVGGTILIANPLADAKLRHLVWCASDLEGDRADRQSAMPWYRKSFDGLLVAPELARQQETVLHANNRIYGVSNDTVERLVRQVPKRASEIGRLSIPVDTEFFRPDVHAEQPGRPEHSMRLGFAGRLDDPRKNAPLLFDALAKLRERRIDVTLSVTGDPTPQLHVLIDRHGVEDCVEFCGYLSRAELRDFYQALDVFILTSHQEGFAIVAMEAMACGIPVVSTNCGGPADYVVSGKTGYLTGFSVDEIADAIAEIATNQGLSATLAQNARDTAVTRYSYREFSRQLRRAWRETWDESL